LREFQNAWEKTVVVDHTKKSQKPGNTCQICIFKRLITHRVVDHVVMRGFNHLVVSAWVNHGVSVVVCEMHGGGNGRAEVGRRT
jgi:hypothetical protein